MSTSARICTVMFGSLPFTAVWEVALHAAADGAPPAWLVATGAAPQVVAAMLAAGIVLGTDKPAQPAPIPAPRRAVTAQPRRKELAR